MCPDPALDKTLANVKCIKFQAVRDITMAFILVKNLLCPSGAYARFYHLDAPEIDREKDRSDEYFNDVLSYRENPLDRVPRNHLSVLAGSLDAKRFYYEEKIKFEKCIAICVGAYRLKKQDTVSEDEQFEISLKANEDLVFSPGFITSLDAHKERADLGASASMHHGPWKFNFQLWSVDHYFNTKKKFDSQHFDKKPRSYLISGEYQADLFDVKLSSSRDFALEWTDQNYFDPNSHKTKVSYPEDRQIYYRYEAKNNEAEVMGKNLPFYFRFSQSQKWEKLGKNDDGLLTVIDFYRNWTTGEVWWKMDGKDAFYAIEFQRIKSTVQAQNASPIAPTVSPLFNVNETTTHELRQQNFPRIDGQNNQLLSLLKVPLEGSSNNQLALATTQADVSSIEREVIGFRIGKNYELSLGHEGILDSTMHWGGKNFHLKIGTHYLYRLATHTTIKLIVTWDLDKAFGNFKKNETIRPWGGGGFSLQGEL